MGIRDWLHRFGTRSVSDAASNDPHICNCTYGVPPVPMPRLHDDVQDTQCDGWRQLVDLIDRAATDGRERFEPAAELGPRLWSQVVTLPPEIGRLHRVRVMWFSGNALVRIPPQIGQMTALREFTPYSSYRLHWFPYEITRCPALTLSTVSTSALYGNFKTRPAFPQLPQLIDDCVPERCSICQGPFSDAGPKQCWISLAVATDVLPLLVHACSDLCIDRLPSSPEGYVRVPHRGGPKLSQPAVSFHALQINCDLRERHHQSQ